MKESTLTEKAFSIIVPIALMCAAFMAGVLLWEYMAMANFTGVIP